MVEREKRKQEKTYRRSHDEGVSPVIQAELYDFHGTLVETASITRHLRNRDFNAFYRASFACPPIYSTVVAAQWSHDQGFLNLLFTGMTRDFEGMLRRWLEYYGVPVDYLDMREPGDFRKDFIVKGEMLERATAAGYEVVKAWDDNPGCLDLWRHRGIPVVPVPGYRAWSSHEVDSGEDGSLSS